MNSNDAPRFALMQGRTAWQRMAFDANLALVDGVVQLAWDTQGEGGTSLPVGDDGAQAGSGLAFDEHCRLYHSVPGGQRVERWLWDAFDPARPQDPPPLADVLVDRQPLPQVLGALPPAPGADFAPSSPALPGFTPRALACDGRGHLFVLDRRTHSVIVLDLQQRRVQRSEPVPADAVHIAWFGRWLWVLAAGGALFRMSASQGLRPAGLSALAEAHQLAFAEDGRIFVLLRAHRPDAAVLELGRPGAWLGTKTPMDFGAINPFAFASGLAVAGCGEHQHLVVARRREEVFTRVALQAPYALAEPLTARRYDGQGIAATPDGRVVFWTPKGARHATAARLHYRGRGRLVGFRLDAGEGRNTWGRILLDACVPAQTQIRIFGLVGDDEIEAERVPRTPPANQALAAIAQAESTPLPLKVMLPADEDEGQLTFQRSDGSEQPWLVENERFDTFEAIAPPVAGRYLWLVIELIGHSRATPRLRGVRAECPAHPWLQRLPQLYSRQEAMRQFLQRFLAAPAGLDEDLAQQADERHALLKPCSTPATVLPWLAHWLGLTLDERWSETARRSFIREAPWLFRLRGTVWALKRMVEIVTGAPVLIVEQFRLRGLGRLGPDPHGQGWDEPAVLGYGLRVGGPLGNAEVREVQGADQAISDSFALNAHRFTVLVQAELDAETEAAVRHLLDVHRPAHTLFTLCGLSQGARIGRGLQVGMSTRIGHSGGWRPLQLGSITIGRLQSHHSVADAEGARRAQAVQQALLDGELEAALSAAGGGDEIVVLRRLQASFTLRAERSDSDNARRWGSTLAAALQRALHHAPARELLRFQRRPQALLAFVADLLQGHTQRDWAWQRLGWLPGRRGEATPGQRHQALLRLLADEPDAGVPLLRALLPTPLWPLLLGRLAPGELQGLVGSVLLQLGGDTAAHFDAWPQPAPEDMAVELSGHAIEPNTDLHHRTWQAAGSSEQRVWALRLLAMLSDPPAARQGAAAIDARVRQWMGGAPAAEAGHPAEPPPAAGAVAAGARRAGEPGPSAARPPMAGHAPPHDDAASPDTGPAPAPHTQFGGLLLLTPLLPISGALHPLEDAAVWPLASLPFALHRLALHLQAMAPHDPGALAFCGLPPGAEPPWPRQALTAAQLQALDQARTRLQAHLAERLPDWPAPRRLALLLQRQARIVADPGWIDVHFSLRDVSLDLRRAALDLDPGFIPWLGLVLRYRYE